MGAHASTIEQDGVITVEFDRPEKRNAIDQPMLDAVWAAVRELARRDELRVMVIRAVGPYFSAGIDLAGEVAQRMAAPSDHPGMAFRRAHREIHLLHDELEAVEKPVVMAIQGPCLGAGLEMATSCDFRFCAPEATFSLPEIQIGVTPGSGGATRLTRLIGPHWTKWVAMAGRQLTADEALRIGLVHEIHPAAALHERVHDFALELALLPADAVGMAKLIVDAAVDADRTTQRHLDRFANTSLFGSPEFVARTRRYTEK